MDTLDLIILGTLVGFLTLAFVLLYPVYRFLQREEQVSKRWTKHELARRAREHPPSNGHANGHERPPAPARDTGHASDGHASDDEP